MTPCNSSGEITVSSTPVTSGPTAAPTSPPRVHACQISDDGLRCGNLPHDDGWPQNGERTSKGQHQQRAGNREPRRDAEESDRGTCHGHDQHPSRAIPIAARAEQWRAHRIAYVAHGKQRRARHDGEIERQLLRQQQRDADCEDSVDAESLQREQEIDPRRPAQASGGCRRLASGPVDGQRQRQRQGGRGHHRQPHEHRPWSEKTRQPRAGHQRHDRPDMHDGAAPAQPRSHPSPVVDGVSERDQQQPREGEPPEDSGHQERGGPRRQPIHRRGGDCGQQRRDAQSAQTESLAQPRDPPIRQHAYESIRRKQHTHPDQIDAEGLRVDGQYRVDQRIAQQRQ